MPFASTWRFSTATPPTNWFAANFNDDSWPVGAAKFGAGSGPTNVVTALPQMLPTYYFRKKFNVVSTNFEELLLCATCTDNYAGTLSPLGVFINGAEIRSTIESVTGQGNQILYFDLTPFAQLIQPGTNTIAVKVGNTWAADWDDVAFDVSLRAVLYHPVVPRLTVQRTLPGAPRVSVESPIGTIWQIQSSDSLSPANWQVMQSFTNAAGGIQTFQDTGHIDLAWVRTAGYRNRLASIGGASDGRPRLARRGALAPSQPGIGRTINRTGGSHGKHSCAVSGACHAVPAGIGRTAYVPMGAAIRGNVELVGADVRIPVTSGDELFSISRAGDAMPIKKGIVTSRPCGARIGRIVDQTVPRGGEQLRAVG